MQRYSSATALQWSWTAVPTKCNYSWYVAYMPM